MEQREMLGPTSCDLSQYTVNKENESNEDTEPSHCTTAVVGRGVYLIVVVVGLVGIL